MSIRNWLLFAGQEAASKTFAGRRRDKQRFFRSKSKEKQKNGNQNRQQPGDHSTEQAGWRIIVRSGLKRLANSLFVGQDGGSGYFVVRIWSLQSVLVWHQRLEQAVEPEHWIGEEQFVQIRLCAELAGYLIHECHELIKTGNPKVFQWI